MCAFDGAGHAAIATMRPPSQHKPLFARFRKIVEGALPTPIGVNSKPFGSAEDYSTINFVICHLPPCEFMVGVFSMDIRYEKATT